MDTHDDSTVDSSRRAFLGGAGLSLGSIALGTLLAREGRAESAGALVPVHHAPKAKRVIWMHMAGAPSQIDLFDPKPKLAQFDRQPIPESFTKGERFAFIKGQPKVLASPYAFARHGQSGAELSTLLPNFARIADKLAIVRSMHTTQFNHAPAQTLLATGNERFGRPSFGSWATYGLGAMNQDLPAFVVLTSGRYGPDAGASLWSSGFLPTVHQGVRLRSQGDPVPFLSNPPGVTSAGRRNVLDALAELNAIQLAARGDPEIATRVAQYELAYRMQTSVPELADLSNEPDSVKKRYGIEGDAPGFARNALLARRMLERGVRFVQMYHWGWDSHGTGPGDDIVTSLPERCRECEPASAALIEDLAERGLLDDTLVVWGGEFGRTPMNEERDGSKFLGRDHHPHAFSIVLAGGGIRPGMTLGATDEFGYRVTEDAVSVHDLHATLLHQLGYDHEKLTFRSQGRDFRLTDVEGEVVRKLLA